MVKPESGTHSQKVIIFLAPDCTHRVVQPQYAAQRSIVGCTVLPPVYFLLNTFVSKKFNVSPINKKPPEKRIKWIVVSRYACKFLFAFSISSTLRPASISKKTLKKNNIKIKIENKNTIKFKPFILAIKSVFFFIPLIKISINLIAKKVIANIEIQFAETTTGI